MDCGEYLIFVPNIIIKNVRDLHLKTGFNWVTVSQNNIFEITRPSIGIKRDIKSHGRLKSVC